MSRRPKHLLVVFLVLILVACGGSEAVPTTVSTTQTEPTPTTGSGSGGAATPEASPGGSDASPAATGETRVVTFAGINALTGRDTAYGLRGHQGAKLAAMQINEAGGFVDFCGNTYTINFTENDMGEDRNQAVTLFRRAADDPNVLAVLGPSPSQGFLSILPVAPQVKLPVIGIGTGAPVAEWNEWAVRNSLVSEVAAPALMRTLMEKFNVTEIAIIYDQTQDANAGEAKLLNEMADDMGYKVVAYEAFKGGDQDFTTQLTTIRGTGVEWVGVYGAPPEAGKIIRQMADMGMDVNIFGGFGTFVDPNTWDLSDGAVEGGYLWTGVDLQSSDPKIQKFVEDYKAAFDGDEPTAFSIYGYDAMWAAVDAVKRSCTATDREAFREALMSTDQAEGLGRVVWNNPPSGENQDAILNIVQVVGRGEGKPLD